MERLAARLRVFINYKDLMGQLVLRDLKLKYRRSVLGYLWSVLNPLFIMIIMAVVFSQMFHNERIPNYPVYLMSGQILFNYMNQSTSQALASIVDSSSLLKKIYLPKYIFTVSKITSGLIDCTFSFAALLLVMVFTGAPVSVRLLLFIPVALQLYVFNIGLGMFLAACNVFFRDIQYIYNAVTTAWMYLTPMFYPVELLPDTVRWLITHFNPMYFYITQLRSLTIYNSLPGLEYAVCGCICSMIMLTAGVQVFLKTQDKFILYI